MYYRILALVLVLSNSSASFASTEAPKFTEINSTASQMVLTLKSFAIQFEETTLGEAFEKAINACYAKGGNSCLALNADYPAMESALLAFQGVPHIAYIADMMFSVKNLAIESSLHRK